MKSTSLHLALIAILINSGHTAFGMSYFPHEHSVIPTQRAEAVSHDDHDLIPTQCAEFVLSPCTLREYNFVVPIEGYPTVNPLTVRAYFDDNRYNPDNRYYMNNAFLHIKKMLRIDPQNPRLSKLNEDIQRFILLAEITRELQIKNTKIPGSVRQEHIDWFKKVVDKLCVKAGRCSETATAKMRHLVGHALDECDCGFFQEYLIAYGLHRKK